MPNTNTGYGRGIGRIQESGAPSQGNRSADAIKALVPGNTRPVSLRPGMVLVGTSHFYSGTNLGSIPLSGHALSSPGTPVPFVGTPATWIQGDAAMFNGNGYLVTSTSGSGGSTVVSTDVVSADILTLDTIPIDILPAPGAGKIIIIDWDLYILTFATVPYTMVSGGIGLFYNFTGSSPFVGADSFGNNQDNNLIQASVNTTSYNLGLGAGTTNVGNGTINTYENKGVSLGATGAVADGDSTLTLIIAYHLEDLP